MSVVESEERSSQAYVHECGDGAYVSVTLSDGPPGHVYPPTVTLGPCLLCEADPTLMRATTPEHLAELDAADEEGPECVDGAEFTGRSLAEFCSRRGQAEGFANPSTPDTSQPYFLDLIQRIDAVTAKRPE